MAIFLKYDGLDGKATIAGYEKWIQLESVQVGTQRAVRVTGMGEASTEHSTPTVSDVIVTRPTDATSVSIIKQSLGGKGHQNAKIDLTTTDKNGKHTAYMQLILTDVQITNYNIMAQADIKGGHHEQPAESFHLVYKKIEWKSMEVGGGLSPKSGGSAGWDASKSEAF